MLIPFTQEPLRCQTSKRWAWESLCTRSGKTSLNTRYDKVEDICNISLLPGLPRAIVEKNQSA